MFLRCINRHAHCHIHPFRLQYPIIRNSIVTLNKTNIRILRLRPNKESTISAPLTLAVTAAFLLGGSILLYRPSGASEERGNQPDNEVQTKEEYYNSMVGITPPGRPGNLTPDQEVKLQELWTSMLKVFGVSFPGNRNVDGLGELKTWSDSPDQPDQRQRAGTVTSDKKKKKRKSLFSRRHNDDPSGEDIEGEHADSEIDSEDKYGQTKEFHEVIASQSPDDLRNAFWSMVKHDHPDALVLRFLRARKWDVEKALIMLITTMHWRMQDMHVDDDVIRKGEGGALTDSQSSEAAVRKEGEDFMTQLRMGKSFLHGTDKEGRPMCFVRVRLHKQGEQSEASLERYTVYVIETARLLLTNHVDTAAVVFDMTGFSMANMDYTPVKFMIKCFEANYPESLGVVLVHKSPWIFQGIWKIIKGWLDPVVAGKVHFTKNVEELEQFVSRSHIIKELGGDDPWTYQYIEPEPGENNQITESSTKQRLADERAATVKEFEVATHDWAKNPKIEPQQKRSELAERLRKGYWQIDPYLRARTLCDRSGIIRTGGVIEFYGSSNGAVSSQNHNGPIPAGHAPDDLD